MNLIGFLMVLGCILFTVIGQLLLKFGAHTLYFPKDFGFEELLKLVWHNLTNLYFIIGLSSAFIASLFWSLAIQKINLSIAYPLMSLSYVIVFLASYLIFHETIGKGQIFGMVLIVCGVFFISTK